jgi:hypothetical protein
MLMARVELWVRLKVTDLVAQTAWITLTEKLGQQDDLRGLVRYSYWDMTAGGASGDAILEEVDRVIKMDSAFTNQNKHLYRLLAAEQDGSFIERLKGADDNNGGILSRGDLAVEKDFPVEGRRAKGLFALDLLVRERESGGEDAYIERLNTRLNSVKIENLRAGEVWRLIISASDAGEAESKAERIAVSRSRSEGLLLNPHFQSFEFITVIPLESKGGGS